MLKNLLITMMAGTTLVSTGGTKVDFNRNVEDFMETSYIMTLRATRFTAEVYRETTRVEDFLKLNDILGGFDFPIETHLFAKEAEYDDVFFWEAEEGIFYDIDIYVEKEQEIYFGAWETHTSNKEIASYIEDLIYRDFNNL